MKKKSRKRAVLATLAAAAVLLCAGCSKKPDAQRQSSLTLPYYASGILWHLHIYIKIYLRMKSTARIYMTGVIFSFFPAKRFMTT